MDGWRQRHRHCLNIGGRCTKHFLILNPVVLSACTEFLANQQGTVRIVALCTLYDLKIRTIMDVFLQMTESMCTD